MRAGEIKIALDEPARLVPNDWSSLEIRMLECSASGFRAACDATLWNGAWVTLEIPGIGAVEALVTWRRDGQFAATFAEPIDLSQAQFMAVNGEVVLARLLKERAKAHAAGQQRQERDLRARISEILPMRRV